MYEDNKKTSITSFFIKLIIVIIFVIFALWLLSSINKGLNSNIDNINNSLNVLTDNIFSENISKMKEVGKEYFTTERLPQNIGDVKSLTLKEMYDKKLILELKDKNGKSCSADNSYVMVEKLDNEYQMKVYLECGKEKNYIIVIMGCYDYCSTTICEKNNSTNNKQIEYEYKKETGGYWTDFGNWSEWSKIQINKTNYRDVETKTEKEEYTYNKTIYNKEYIAYQVSCPSGYNLNSNYTQCYKVIKKNEYVEPTICPKNKDGFTLVSQNGFTCNYQKNYTTTITANPLACPSTLDGFTLVSQNGFTCNYQKNYTTTITANPLACPSTLDGFNLISQNGFNCNYSKTELISKTCYSQQLVQSCSTCAPVLKNIPYDCSYNSTTTKETTVGCPSGYTKNGNTCVSSTNKTENKQTTVGCPYGYTKNDNTCVSSTNKTENKQTTVGCPVGFNKTSDNTKCYKETQETKYANIINSCPAGYKTTNDNTKCYKEVSSVIKATGTKNTTYYRYRIRQYIGGTVDYKWSTSQNDKNLINAGYTLTGRTR